MIKMEFLLCRKISCVVYEVEIWPRLLRSGVKFRQSTCICHE